MTETVSKRVCAKRRPREFSPSGILLTLLSSVLLWYLIRYPALAGEAVLQGLDLTVKRVIPSLFPFLVLSSLLLFGGVCDKILALPSRALSLLLGVSPRGASAMLLGCLFGFPVGGRLLGTLKKQGAITAREYSRLLPLSNHPSFAFLYSAVGGSLLNRPRLGLLLYVSMLLSAVSIGIATRGRTRDTDKERIPKSDRAYPSLTVLLTESVKSATATTVTAAGFIVFFSVLYEAFSTLIPAVGLPSALTLPLSGILEVSCGMKTAAELTRFPASRLCGYILCGFFAGFGGISAHLQVIATVEGPLPGGAEGHRSALRSFVFCKCVEGILSAAVFLGILLLFGAV